ncbi:IclR family transcriptional regulator [Actinomycetospora termitidis]|uniref:IclR family transcriptional regulator C-terminal domain-containing protein n=1 Tax=Actinomycetospora termitidis TaxID=3053470 RepID=A0ABT7M3E7_9PSEU|nr:IclR family transcriptional regulator C-terminal domain-containing protein [Actinomycetospora sp. Odt1-22]MDL5155190.1 IclR family transcriptional regulator C-terminal domain-containing protein [Actinomycetospora sp. Odt1-22]
MADRSQTGGRSLKTAAEALAALRLLADAPDGLTADGLGTAIGKSSATARYLLNTLCQEGYARRDGRTGIYRLGDAPPWGSAWGGGPEVEVEDEPAAAEDPDTVEDALRPLRREDDPVSRYELPESLADAVTELYWRTRQRSYLARWDGDATVIVDARGHQGLARIPDLRERIPVAQAHALAVTKALVATSSEIEELLLAQPSRTAFTATTITTTPGLEQELARVRRDGIAVDREEFAEGFCCVGAPIVAPDGRVAASIAVSSPARRFAQDSAALTSAVREVAATAMREWRARVASTRDPTAEEVRPA